MTEEQGFDSIEQNGDFEAEWGLEDTQQKQGEHETYVSGLGPAIVTFVDFGDIRKYQNRRGGATFGPDIIAELLCEHFVEPDLEEQGLDADMVDSMEPEKPDALLSAITGDEIEVEMGDDGTATLAPAENGAESEEGN